MERIYAAFCGRKEKKKKRRFMLCLQECMAARFGGPSIYALAQSLTADYKEVYKGD